MSELELQELINRIKNRRLELDLSYQELSDLTGISKSTLQRYETGFIKKVPVNQIELIAKALRVSPSYLMGWDDSPAPEPPALTHRDEQKRYLKLIADAFDLLSKDAQRVVLYSMRMYASSPALMEKNFVNRKQACKLIDEACRELGITLSNDQPADEKTGS